MPLAAFAHEPLDAVSACIAVLNSEAEPTATIRRVRELGAPVVFVVHRGKVQWWSQDVARPRHLGTLDRGELRGFFEEHRDQLAPESIYRAKTRGRFESSYQLDFVDVGLMPLVEEELGRKLSELIERAFTVARHSLPKRKISGPVTKWLLQSVFWLLAAKILRDKKVPGFDGLNLQALEEVFTRVADHYGAEDRGFGLQSPARRRALQAASGILEPFSSLAHVTPESLASVYESTLVSKEARAALGIHSTPSFLARYIVWRLAPWIEEIPQEERHVFEPTCGQGAFLVTAMRLLRDLLPGDTKSEERRNYLRGHLHGLDIDPFAIELARLSLTLADIPNPDGWDLRSADAFHEADLGEIAKATKIFLANPPFQNFKAAERERCAQRGMEIRPGSKAAELLRRILPHLDEGAVFGIVVPQGLLHSRGAAELRSTLVRDFEIAEIALLPDKIFAYSDAESAVLLARRSSSAGKDQNLVRYVRVRDADVDRFRAAHRPSVERQIPQARFAEAPEHSLAVPELEEVWEACHHLPKLGSLTEVGKGLEYKGKDDLPEGATTFSTESFPEAQRGFVKVDRALEIHAQPREFWLNLDPGVIRRTGAGAVTGQPQLIVNHARVSRGPWRLKAILDPAGHAITYSFLAIRPRHEELPLLYLWAILNSPLANAYCFAHSTTRHNLKKTVRAIPVPRVSPSDIRSVSRTANEYLEAVGRETDLPLTSTADPARLRRLLLALDAEVLRLYDLPPRLERELLDLFAGHQRPGVPFAFDRYFPPDFEPWIRLHHYLTEDFRRSTAGALRAPEKAAPEPVVEALRVAADAFQD